MTVLCFACATKFSNQDEFDKHKCVQQESLVETESKDKNDPCLCTACGKRFSRPFCRIRHQRESKCKLQMETKRTTCKFCNKQFTSYRYRLTHEKRCQHSNAKPQSITEQLYTCQTCNGEFKTVSQLKTHQNITKHGINSHNVENCLIESNTQHKRHRDGDENCVQKRMRTERSFISCRQCDNFKCSTSKELYDHKCKHHSQREEIASSFQPLPFRGKTLPWENEDGTVDREFEKAYNQHKHLILKRKKTNLTNVSRYNFPTPVETTIDQLKQQLEEIYEDCTFSFKINLSFGILLRHIRTGQVRYFAPFSNENVFDMPMLISNRNDINAYMQRLEELDILNYIMRQRPESVWKPVLICNVLYTIYRTSFPLGNSKKLPNFIRKNKSVISLFTHPVSGKAYEDDLCMFRCLAYHNKKSAFGIERLTKQFHTQWVDYVKNEKLKSSDVNLSNIFDVERCFQVNINIFSLYDNKSVDVLYKSRRIYGENTLNLNLHENHLSYISNFQKYAGKFRCQSCNKMFPTIFRLNRHKKSCEKVSRLKFPGGYYKQNKTIFEKLEEFNIFVKPELRHFPWVSVFDLESVLIPETNNSSLNRHLVSSHKPICVCLASNVPGFEKEKFILNKDTDVLLDHMCKYLSSISDRTKELARQRWDGVFQSLQALEERWCFEDTFAAQSSVINNNVSLENVESFDASDAEETNEYEPPSAEFLDKMSKENVWHRFTQSLHSRDEINVQYNDWSDCEETGISSESDSSFEEESRNNFDIIQPFQPLNSTSQSDNLVRDQDNEDEDDDYADDVILPFTPLTKRNLSAGKNLEEEEDDDDDVNEIELASASPAQDIGQSSGQSNCNNNVNSDVGNSSVSAQLMKRNILKLKSEFELYCQQLPVIGFNSGKYDINLIKCELALHLGLHQSKGRKFILKKNNNYICVANDKLKFLDLSNYLPAGTSYDSFLLTFNVPVRKSYFPYEYLTDADKLDEMFLPPKECFFSTLKNCNTLENKIRLKYCRLIEQEGKTVEEALKILKISEIPSSSIDENYERLQQIWKEKNMKNLRDFLQHYAELDVGPMVQGIETFQKFFFQKGLDIFKDYVSIPGVARKMLYDCGIKHGASFSLFDKFDADLYETFMNSLVGGPSIIFCRHHKINETFIRNNENHPCQSIFGYDANSLYLHSICSDMPVGRYIRRKRENDFKPENKVKRYYAMYDWMNWIGHSEGKVIKHKMNYGREFRVGPYYVDGKSDTNQIYEFLGCYFHGCPKCYPTDKKQAENFRKTMNRLEFIREQGFQVKYIWECDYRQELKVNEAMRNFVNQNAPTFYRKYPTKVSQDKIIDSIMNDELFGFVEIDIQIPDSWDQVKFKPQTELNPYDYFEEMSPLFVTTEVPFEKIGKHMQDHAKAENLSQKPRKLLVGGLRAEKILLMTPLLKWYISHGMLVTKVHQVIEYSKMACFKEFGEQVTNARREGDSQNAKKIIALLFKLIGNSAFGGTIMNKEKFKRHKYFSGFRNACLAVNNPRFNNLVEFDNEIFEAEFRKAGIVLDNPVILGIAILNMAKLHLLRFYYEFLDQFIERKHFQCLECDTDSLYFALSTKSLSEAIKPERKKEFLNHLNGNCSDSYKAEPAENNVWFPRECCTKHNKYDQRTPGLMKKEFEASSMTGLSSKSYVAKLDRTGEVKYSLKGVNKEFVDPTEQFEQVLSSKNSINSINRGIAVYNNKMYSYSQEKRAFTYFYCKRQVCDDGIHTKPLDICLKPMKRKVNDL